MTQYNYKIVYILIFLAFNIQYIYSTVKIIAPKQLIEGTQTNLEPYHISNFGFVPYGSIFTAPLKIANPYDACTHLQSVEVKNPKQKFILLVQKSDNCSYVQKVRNAQAIGANMVIFADNIQENVLKVVINDVDGTGQNINIPSILIKNDQGQELFNNIQRIQQNNKTNNEEQELLLQVAFEVEKTETVDFKLFIDLNNPNELSFIYNFKKKYSYIYNQVKFQPVYYTETCQNCKPYDKEVKDCLGGGKYCISDPDGSGPATGRDILYEQIRQLCIFNQINEQTWWIYMSKFQEKCKLRDNFLENCSYQSFLETIEYNSELDIKLKLCIANSYQIDKTKNKFIQENTILYENNDILQDHPYINTWPAIMINNQIYNGALYTNNVMEALCASLRNPPRQCSEFSHPFFDPNNEVGKQEPDTDIFNDKDVNNKQKTKGDKLSVFWISIITIVSIFSCLGLSFLFYIMGKRYFIKQEEDNDSKMNELVSQYIQFYEAKERKQKEKKIKEPRSTCISEENESKKTELKFQLDLKHSQCVDNNL